MTTIVAAGKLARMGWLRRRTGSEASAGIGSAGDDTPPPAAAAERYRRGDFAAIAVGEGEALVHLRGGEGLLLPESALDLLRRCTTFRTLDDHGRALVEELHLDASLHGPVRAELGRLADLGLLIPHSQVWRDAVAAHAADADPPPPAITTIAILTCNRPEAAVRCAASVVENARRHGRTPAIVVSDDSRDPATAAATRNAIAHLAANDPAFHYVGRETRADFAATLLREAGDGEEMREAVRFALHLDGNPHLKGAGANRNHLLLRLAGTRFLSLDDDTVCRLAPAPGGDADLALASRPDPSELWFFPDRDTALAAAAREDVDLLALHEGYLGRTAAACVAAVPDAARLDLDDADDALLRRLGAGARIAVTAAGLAGDSGMASPSYYLTLRGASRARLLADYPAFRNSRAVVRAVPRPTLSAGAFLMTPCVGLDAATLLPPFLPIGHNDDGLFAATLRRVAPDGLIAHLPWTITHDPSEARAFAPELRHLPLEQVSIEDLLALCLTAAPLGPAGDPAARMVRLGRQLQEIAALPDPDLHDLLYHQRLAQMGRHLAHLEASLHLYDGRPEPWAADVGEAIAAIRDALQRPDAIIPPELRDPDRPLAGVRDWVRRFGQLVELWPTLFAAAQRMEGLP